MLTSRGAGARARYRLRCAVWLTAGLVSSVAPLAAQSLRSRMIAAEDARVATDAAIAPLLQGTSSADAATAAQAVRGLGRFERPAFVRHILPLVTDRRAAVRREAVNALGQSLASVSRSADVAAQAEL